MTCIAAIAHGPHVTLCGDSAVSYSGTRIVRANSKVTSYGEFVVGSSGSARVLDLLRYHYRPTNPPPDCDIDAFMVTDFCAGLHGVLSDFGALKKEDGEMPSFGEGAILVGIRGAIYFIDHVMSCHRVADPYFAIGSGGDFALGSLATTAREPSLPAGERLLTALDIATKFCETVHPPFQFAHTLS